MCVILEAIYILLSLLIFTYGFMDGAYGVKNVLTVGTLLFPTYWLGYYLLKILNMPIGKNKS